MVCTLGSDRRGDYQADFDMCDCSMFAWLINEALNAFNSPHAFGPPIVFVKIALLGNFLLDKA